MTVSYSPIFHPFPFPKDLDCGQPYINWPAGKDIVGLNIDVDVVIPEEAVVIGVGKGRDHNKTKEAYSLVMPRKRTVRCDTTKFVPMYRNKIFETSDDKFYRPGAAYLEYLGPPSLHVKDHTCGTPYHLLSYSISLSVLAGHHLLSSEGNDWLYHLYAGNMGSRPYDMPSREPLATSPVINVCDNRARHTKYSSADGFTCDFPEYVEPAPAECPVPTATPRLWNPMSGKTPPPEAGGNGTIVGMVVGLVLGLLGLVGLVLLAVKYAPQVRRRFRRDGAIRL